MYSNNAEFGLDLGHNFYAVLVVTNNALHIVCSITKISALTNLRHMSN